MKNEWKKIHLQYANEIIANLICRSFTACRNRYRGALLHLKINTYPTFFETRLRSPLTLFKVKVDLPIYQCTPVRGTNWLKPINTWTVLCDLAPWEKFSFKNQRKFKRCEIGWNIGLSIAAAAPSYNSPAHPHTAPAYAHYCPCPAASD